MAEMKRCPYCGQMFKPDPRTQGFQKACPKAQCRKARKREADRFWRQHNPGYGKSRTLKVRQWARSYPDYWKSYRRRHLEYTGRNQEQTRRRMRLRRLVFAKQDAIARTNAVEYLQGVQRLGRPGMFAKQDAMRRQVDEILGFLMVKELFAKPNDIAQTAP